MGLGFFKNSSVVMFKACSGSSNSRLKDTLAILEDSSNTSSALWFSFPASTLSTAGSKTLSWLLASEQDLVSEALKDFSIMLCRSLRRLTIESDWLNFFVSDGTDVLELWLIFLADVLGLWRRGLFSSDRMGTKARRAAGFSLLLKLFLIFILP